MVKIWARYGQDIAKILWRYCQDIFKIWWMYGQDMVKKVIHYGWESESDSHIDMAVYSHITMGVTFTFLAILIWESTPIVILTT